MEPDSDREEGVLPANIADLPATSERDRLGFQPYVRAVAEFLMNPATKGPLAMSVEGEWGSGKSSFMLQLEEALKASAGRPLTVRFNAWRHDKADALWAAFALELTRSLASNLPGWERYLGHLKLARLRFDWKEGWIDLARAAGLWLAWVFAIITGVLYGWDWLKRLEADWPAFIALFTGAGATLAQAFSWLSEAIGNPLKAELKKHLKSPNYEQHLSLIEQFHRDFSRIVRAYAGTRPVFVFVDDLDRCEVPKAAELMQALNLMMPDEQELYFILGMDRHKVAAGLAVRHEKLLPYLREGERSEDSRKQSAEWFGLRYGYDFIEKFIQIPFVIPRPAGRDLEKYVESLAEPAEAAGSAVTQKPATGPSVAPGTQAPAPGPQGLARREEFKLHVTGDSPSMQRIVLRVAPTLGGNPRRIKQFLNLLRLRTFIAAETGLLDGADLTLEQLGTFVALSLRWPLLIADLEAEPKLTGWLENPPGAGSLEYNNPLRLRWGSDAALRNLLKGGSLEGVNLGRMLEVLPRVRTIDLRPRAAEPRPRQVERAVAVGAEGGTGTSSSPVREQVLTGNEYQRVILSMGGPQKRQAEQLARSLADQGIRVARDLETSSGPGVFLHCLYQGDSIAEVQGMIKDMTLRGLRPALVILPDAKPAISDELREFPLFDLRNDDGFPQLVGFIRGPQMAPLAQA